MHFSSLSESLGGSKNPLYRIHEELKLDGRAVIDLVRGNVNEHGIEYPQDVLKDILQGAAEAARIYHPDSFGQPGAREAIAAYYGGRIPANQIVVTPGTSVSYWYCFKLLAESGDEILTPQPSYPLFDYIARLCGVHLRYYRLRDDQGWRIDLNYLEDQITTKTRAIVLISPHNPTGMVASEDELRGLSEIATRHRLPIIFDEVFSEFLFGIPSLPRPSDTGAPLVFTLNGFSKMFALAGMKIGWIGISGDERIVAKAMTALEMISDTFLPVNEIAQFAAPQVFKQGQDFLKNYQHQIRACRQAALDGLAGLSKMFVEPSGGFYITLKILQDEETVAEGLLREAQILTHPGFFYDIKPDHLVMTFIHEPEVVRRCFGKIAEFVCRRGL
jgi:aspartate/methionine/tyrosine aminotransferase